MPHHLPPTTADEPHIRILGSIVNLVSVTGTVDYMERWIEERSTCRRIVVSGFHGLWEAYNNTALGKVFNSADLWVPDGIAPVWVARLRRYKNVERTPGIDIMHHFFRRTSTRRYRSYFYGDTHATLEKLQNTLSNKYPAHEIAGTYSPPFRALTREEDSEIIRRINESHPDVLWVGLGLPKQEIWIYERRHELKVPVAIGVGAAFGFLAGTVSRCPRWLGSMGFEWAYRFIKEPNKVWRRDIVDGPRFLYHLGRELLSGEQISADHRDQGSLISK